MTCLKIVLLISKTIKSSQIVSQQINFLLNLGNSCVIPEPTFVPGKVMLRYMQEKKHPAVNEEFAAEMTSILIAMEFENLKRLMGLDNLCAGRNKVVTKAWAENFVSIFFCN